MLQQQAGLRLRIEGHTDNVGKAAYNLELSKRRAESVKTYLVSKFQLDASRLTTEGFGDTRPIAKNDTDQGRAQNRRVELVKQ
jgi:OOP family OmpA-OmpF porin